MFGWKSRAALARLAEVAATGAVLAFFPAVLGFGTWHEVRALQRQWSVVGPTCAVHRKGPTPPQWGHFNKGFSYGEARWDFGRALASCADIPKPGLLSLGTYQVCQFNNPSMVRVQTRKGVVIFGPLNGDRATVTVKDGLARCVIGGWFATSEDPGAR